MATDPWFPADVRGWLHDYEGEALAALAAGLDVLEIGTYCGRSAVCLAQTARSVHAVDWHRGDPGAGFGWTLDECAANLRRYGVADRVVLHVGRSDAVCPLLAAGAFGLAFIDGAHDAASVAADTRHALRLLRPGGLIAYHDWDLVAVREAADRLLPRRQRNTAGGLMWQTV